MKETQLDGESLDIVSDNVSKLKEIFPEVITEDKIDFDKLKLILGSDIETDSERYSFTWPGKTQAIKESQKQSTGTLRPCKEESKNWDTTKNLYIEGENLEVLKLLQKSYYNKIKMIYIDPPYNTGNDFVYKDDYKDNLANYLEISRQTRYGQALTTNTETDGRYHSNWLNMMYTRLKLARNLLKGNGVIFISIDDNELNNLKKICDEIFGELNFLAILVWTNKEGGGSSDSKHFRIKHEYILVYCKNIEKTEINGVEISNLERYKSKDEYFSERGPYYLQKLNMSSIQYSDSLNYPIISPDGEELWPGKGFDDKTFCWRWSKNKLEWGLKKGMVEFKKDSKNKWQVYTKQYLRMDNNGNIIERTQRPMGVIDKFSSTQSSKYLQKLFDGNKVFDYSKPFELIKFLLELSISENDIVLDFFSGSATTADALFKFNSEKSTRNNFILVQLEELVDNNKTAYELGYENICEIGKERIRKTGEHIVQESGNKGLDIGFKVFKLDSSNLNKWDPDYDNLEQTLLVSQDNIKPDRTQEDLIYEIMLKYGIDLTLPIEEYDAGENKIYSIGFGALLICLDNKITKDITDSIIELASEDVSRVVFKDNGFASDADKTNIKETLRSHHIDEFITI